MQVLDALITAGIIGAAGCVARIPERRWSYVALGVGVLQAVLRFGAISLQVRGLNLWLLLAALLAVAGAGAWLRATNKAAVTSATLVVMTGAMQVLILASR
jgi:hypothetical protein